MGLDGVCLLMIMCLNMLIYVEDFKCVFFGQEFANIHCIIIYYMIIHIVICENMSISFGKNSWHVPVLFVGMAAPSRWISGRDGCIPSSGGPRDSEYSKCCSRVSCTSLNKSVIEPILSICFTCIYNFLLNNLYIYIYIDIYS